MGAKNVLVWDPAPFTVFCFPGVGLLVKCYRQQASFSKGHGERGVTPRPVLTLLSTALVNAKGSRDCHDRGTQHTDMGTLLQCLSILRDYKSSGDLRAAFFRWCHLLQALGSSPEEEEGLGPSFGGCFVDGPARWCITLTISCTRWHLCES